MQERPARAVFVVPLLLGAVLVAWSLHAAAPIPEPDAWRNAAGDPELRLFPAEWAEFEGEPATVLHRWITTRTIETPGGGFRGQRGFAAMAACVFVFLLLSMDARPLRAATAGGAIPVHFSALLGLCVFHPSFGATWLLGTRFGGFAALALFALAMLLLREGRGGGARRAAAALVVLVAMALDPGAVLFPFALLPAVLVGARGTGRPVLGVAALWLLFANLAALLIRWTATAPALRDVFAQGFAPWLGLLDASVLPGTPNLLRYGLMALLCSAATAAALRRRAWTGTEARAASLILLGFGSLVYAGARCALSGDDPRAESERWPGIAALLIGLTILATQGLRPAYARAMLAVLVVAASWSCVATLPWMHERRRELDAAAASIPVLLTPGAPVPAVPEVFRRIDVVQSLVARGFLPDFSADLEDRMPERIEDAPTAPGQVSINAAPGGIRMTIGLGRFEACPVLAGAWVFLDDGGVLLAGVGRIERDWLSDRAEVMIPFTARKEPSGGGTLRVLAIDFGSERLRPWPAALRVGPDLVPLPGEGGPR